MSAIPIGTTLLAANVLGLVPLTFFRPRSIGGIVANVTIEERGVDELSVTDHPVENGAAITDHAFKRPASLTINAGWSNSALQAAGDPNYVISIYDALLELQSLREPFDVVTGKRIYQNMLMTRLYQVTNERSENALDAIIECRELIIVSTQTVTVPPAANMKQPLVNGATVNDGAKQLTPAPNFNSSITGPR